MQRVKLSVDSNLQKNSSQIKVVIDQSSSAYIQKEESQLKWFLPGETATEVLYFSQQFTSWEEWWNLETNQEHAFKLGKKKNKNVKRLSEKTLSLAYKYLLENKTKDIRELFNLGTWIWKIPWWSFSL